MTFFFGMMKVAVVSSTAVNTTPDTEDCQARGAKSASVFPSGSFARTVTVAPATWLERFTVHPAAVTV